VTWGSWSEWYDASLDIDFELNLTSKGRYFQYQVHFYGNKYFESPELYSGIETTYYQNQAFTVFFQSNDLDMNTDDYLASIHITHKADIPSTSIVRYGYTQFDTTNYEDYYSTTRPLITPDRHTIILTRYNERFLTEDHQTYTAINGGWNENATIEVYKINDAIPSGQLIDSTTYAPNHVLGTIKFNNIQNDDDEFVLCVYFDPSYRILCNVINYGPDYVVIDHIALLYNVSKRISRDNLGNIIHIPINKVIS